MSKLRALESKAATLIQQQFRLFKNKMLGKPRSRACQTETLSEHAFQRMAFDFYSRLGSQNDLNSALKKSIFETCTLFYLAAKLERKKGKGREQTTQAD